MAEKNYGGNKAFASSVKAMESGKPDGGDGLFEELEEASRVKHAVSHRMIKWAVHNLTT
jgi:hypothetical protein